MEFWGVEVLAGKSVKVKPDFETIIHVSQAALEKAKKGETALLYVTVGGQKLVLGTLSQGNIPQINFDLIFEKEFELSHSLESGSVHFTGYRSPNMPEEEDFSDSEEEEAVAVPATANGGSNIVNADLKPRATTKPAEVKPESDEDDDSEEDGSDSEEGMDVDEDDSEEEDDSEDEDDETPKKPEVSNNKKRPNESASAASKTPLSAKKAKPATPHPAAKKGGGKSPMNANQSPKSGGQSPSGGGANKKQFNSGKQFGSNNKGKGKGKGRA